MSGQQKKRRLGLVLFAVLAIAAGGWFAYSNLSDRAFRTVPPLDISAYSTRAASLQGNTYQLKGEVLALLAWSPSGRLVSVGVDGDKHTIPVLLPNDLHHVNIERGHQLRFLVLVEDQGILRVTKLAEL